MSKLDEEKPIFDVYETSAGSDSEFEHQLNDLGAPVEKHNPLGTDLNYISLFYFVISGVIGTGIFATPGTILKQIGSVGASYVLWVSGFIITLFKVLIYVEYVTYFPDRSGGDVAYLEQAYPKPEFLVPTTYAAINVLFSFATSSATAFGSYILKAAHVAPTTWNTRGVGVAALALTTISSAISTKWSLRFSNWLGHVKIITLFFIAISGIVVLAGGTSVQNPTANFHNAWNGTTKDPNSIANGIIKISFSYGGTGYAFSLVSEMPFKKRIKGYKYLVPGTFFFIFVMYILCVTAFYAGSGSISEIKASSVLTASLFFHNVFGSKGETALNVLVALSALGHLFTVIVGHSRSLRECGRQGVLPFKNFWVSVKPWGTPLGPVLITFLINIIVLLAPPAGDAYNFVTSLGSYSGYVFDFFLAVGLLFVRRQRKNQGLGSSGFRVPLPIVIIQILFQLFVLAMPLVPPSNGSLKGSDVSFFYATYCIVVFGLLGLCLLYYVIWQFVLPRFGRYAHRVEQYTLENGAKGNRVIKVSLDELEEWDAKKKHIATPTTSN
jgi:amino acid transporter